MEIPEFLHYELSPDSGDVSDEIPIDSFMGLWETGAVGPATRSSHSPDHRAVTNTACTRS